VPDLVQAALNLLIDGEHGLWHLVNHGAVSWAGFAQMVAEAAGLNVGLIDAVPGATLGQVALRPRYSALQSERGLKLASLQDAVGQYLVDVEPNLLLEKTSEVSVSAVNDTIFAAAVGDKTERSAVL
jgi:dTDP-4-dehydrorhamnose reductase